MENQQANQIVKMEGFSKRYAKFIIGKSDLFTIMNILGEFMKFLYIRCPTLDDVPKLESAISDFAIMYALIAKSLKAIFLNLRQLINIFESLIEDQEEKTVKINIFWPYL